MKFLDIKADYSYKKVFCTAMSAKALEAHQAGVEAAIIANIVGLDLVDLERIIAGVS